LSTFLVLHLALILDPKLY